MSRTLTTYFGKYLIVYLLLIYFILQSQLKHLWNYYNIYKNKSGLQMPSKKLIIMYILEVGMFKIFFLRLD